MTNFEKLNKSPKELLAFIMSVAITDCFYCPICEFCNMHDNDDSHNFDTCSGTWKQWLESEVEQ